MSNSSVVLIDLDLDDDHLFEIIDGVRVKIPPMSVESSVIASRLAFCLGNFGELRIVGRTTVLNLFRLPLPMDRHRRPDVAFVSFDRWPLANALPSTDSWDVLPEIVAEVVSPSDLAEKILEKIDEYFQVGIKLVWVVYPRHRLVYVYESRTKVRILTREDSLDGGDLLPGFQLPLSMLFVAES